MKRMQVRSGITCVKYYVRKMSLANKIINRSHARLTKQNFKILYFIAAQTEPRKAPRAKYQRVRK